MGVLWGRRFASKAMNFDSLHSSKLHSVKKHHFCRIHVVLWRKASLWRNRPTDALVKGISAHPPRMLFEECNRADCLYWTHTLLGTIVSGMVAA